MTITTPVRPDARKDTWVDRRIDVQIDGRKAVGKANLAAMLAEAGRRVLIVDCDPQANLSEAFGWYADIPGATAMSTS